MSAVRLLHVTLVLLASALALPIAADPEEKTSPAQGSSKPEEVVITGRRARELSYLPEAPVSSGKLDIDVRDSAQSVQVISTELLAERGVSTLNEAIETAVGVQAISGYGGMDSAGVVSRGFSNDWVLRNGFRLFRFGVPVEPASLDRIEVLKGPASLLAGQIDPGGTVNLVSKHPPSERLIDLEAAVGSNDFYRTTFDVGGPVPHLSGGLSLRLSGAIEDAKSHRDFADQSKVSLSPALAWEIGERGKLDVEFDYFWNRFDFERGLPPHPTTFEVPRSRSLSNPRLPGSKSENWAFFETFTYELGESDWRIRQGLAGLFNDNDIQEIASFDYRDDFGNVDLYRSHSVEYNDGITAQLELIGDWELAGREQKSVVGIEFSTYRFGYDFFTPPTGFDSIPGFELNVFAPDYSYVIPAADTPVFGGEYGADGYSIYFDQQLRLPAELQLVLGGRLDWVRGYYENGFDRVPQYPRRTQFRFSPRAGIVWTPIESTDLFFSYATSFKPNPFGIDEEGELFDPEIGEQFELGIRHELIPGQLRAQLALYEITKRDIVVYELPAFTPRLSGERRTRGVEVELIGSPLEGWELTFGYALGESEISEDEDPAAEDSRLFGAPKHQVSLWTTYDVGDGPFAGLRLGYGLFFVGERLASEPFGTKLPSHVRHDVMASYAWSRFEVQLNVENIGNDRIYATHGYNVYPQPGVSARGTLRVSF
jgi:iron complex outermembrane receptor protein